MDRKVMTGAELVDIAAPEASEALAMGLYALHDLLVTKGILDPGEAATNLRRYRGGPPKLMGFLETLAEQLDVMPFGPSGTLRLNVIDGGKPDDDGPCAA